MALAAASGAGRDVMAARPPLLVFSDDWGRHPSSCQHLVRRWVYYCVDDFGEWPGLDGTALRRMEEVVVRRADTLIAVSQTLQDRLAQMGRASHLLTHGVDLDFWAGPGEGEGVTKLQNL